MFPFSIEFLTGQTDLDVKKDDGGSDGDYPNTPSPVGRVPSPTPSDEVGNNSDSPKSIAEVLRSLEKNSKLESEVSESENKPPHSYIALISMAILSTPNAKMVLADIYQYLMDNYEYYNNQKKAWRNSIRHNLSLNECFIKNGRTENGKGNYWSIHPACVEDFSRGDFRRRQARRRARKNMKDISQRDFPSAVSGSVGYVPMTSSAIGYQPYAAMSQQYFMSPFPGSVSAGIAPQMPAIENFQSNAHLPHSYGFFSQNFSGPLCNLEHW